MIFINNKLVTAIRDKVIEKYPTCNVVTSNIERLADGNPCVALNLINDVVDRDMDDERKINHNSILTFQTDIYVPQTNDYDDQEIAYDIMNIVDDVLLNLNFTRTYSQPQTNMDDTIYRLVNRYRVGVEDMSSSDGGNYYFMYRR